MPKQPCNLCASNGRDIRESCNRCHGTGRFEYDPESLDGVGCESCDNDAVGYDDGAAVCASCYQSRDAR
jgi:formate dehydrogenase maturation protein FdhE